MHITSFSTDRWQSDIGFSGEGFRPGLNIVFGPPSAGSSFVRRFLSNHLFGIPFNQDAHEGSDDAGASLVKVAEGITGSTAVSSGRDVTKQSLAKRLHPSLAEQISHVGRLLSFDFLEEEPLLEHLLSQLSQASAQLRVEAPETQVVNDQANENNDADHHSYWTNVLRRLYQQQETIENQLRQSGHTNATCHSHGCSCPKTIRIINQLQHEFQHLVDERSTTGAIQSGTLSRITNAVDLLERQIGELRESATRLEHSQGQPLLRIEAEKLASVESKLRSYVNWLDENQPSSINICDADRCDVRHGQYAGHWWNTNTISVLLDRKSSKQTQEVNDSAPKFHKTVWNRASQFLSEMTDQRLQRIESDANDENGEEFDVLISDVDGRWFTLDSLAHSERDIARLALSLGLAESYSEQGVELPLLLENPFRRLHRFQARSVAKTLRAFCETGHQLLLFTQDEETTSELTTAAVPKWEIQSLRAAISATRSVDMPTADDRKPEIINSVSNATIEQEASDTRLSEAQSEAGASLLLRATGVFEENILEDLSQVGISNLNDLLAANAEEISQQLTHRGTSSSQIEQWQGWGQLSAFVPELTAGDTRLLVASGVSDPDELADSSPEELSEWLHLFIASDDDSSFADSNKEFDLPRMRRWIESARRNRERWRNSRAHRSYRSRSVRSSRNQSARNSSRRSRRDSRHESSSNTRSRRSRDRSSRSRRDGRDSSATKFYLNLTDEVQQAPSIGSRMAERLAKASINSISDLLNADPTKLATRMNFRRVTAETITQWQHQAGLVMRVPNLRGHDAQFLTGCDVITPEQLAAMNPTALFELVQQFANTKEGKRILRGGNEPDLEEVSEWISWASQSRGGKAA